MTNPIATRNPVALITGASRGIGESIARRLAGKGVEVILNGRTLQSLEVLQAAIESDGGKARIEPADLADREEILNLASRCGPVDILINNAASPEKYFSILADEDEHWEKTMNILMWAPVLLTRILAREMKENNDGVIINISSVNAQFHAPYLAPYCMAKSALETFTRSAAMELGPFGIRVNAISPGIIRTQLTEELLGDGLNQLQGIVPAGRAGMPGEVASLVDYLCSDEAAYINGSVYKIDGGFTAGNFPQASKRNIK
jgi:NAD(P)-dependent dehydrogenase (short-subunit alcohol dehydrogenase family)